MQDTQILDREDVIGGTQINVGSPLRFQQPGQSGRITFPLPDSLMQGLLDLRFIHIESNPAKCGQMIRLCPKGKAAAYSEAH